MVVVHRIFEPKRPADYKELPRYDRADYWHCMARTVDIKSDDLVEVPQYPDQIRRVVTFFLALLMVFTIYMGATSAFGSLSGYFEKVKGDYEYIFHFEERVSQQFDRRVERGNSVESEREEFIQEMLDNPIHSHRFLKRIFWFHFAPPSMVLMFLWLAFFTPRACPLRFDRKRELAYTWHKGQLWIADIGPFLGGMETRLATEDDGHPIYGQDTSNGALALTMFCKDERWTTREFKIGTYPVCHSHQSHDLRMFLQAFMSKHLYEPGRSEEWVRRKDWNADWLKKVTRGRFFPYDPMRWLGAKSFIRPDFDETATEAALMDYLTTPSTPDRGKRRGSNRPQQDHRGLN